MSSVAVWWLVPAQGGSWGQRSGGKKKSRQSETHFSSVLTPPDLENGEYASLIEMLLAVSFIALHSLCLKTPGSVFPILASVLVC